MLLKALPSILLWPVTVNPVAGVLPSEASTIRNSKLGNAVFLLIARSSITSRRTTEVSFLIDAMSADTSAPAGVPIVVANAALSVPRMSVLAVTVSTAPPVVLIAPPETIAVATMSLRSSRVFLVPLME